MLQCYLITVDVNNTECTLRVASNIVHPAVTLHCDIEFLVFDFVLFVLCAVHTFVDLSIHYVYGYILTGYCKFEQKTSVTDRRVFDI